MRDHKVETVVIPKRSTSQKLVVSLRYVICYCTQIHKLAYQFHDFSLNHLEIYFIYQSNWDEVVDNFDDMNLREELLRGIYAYGFEKPSAIQQRAIIPCIKGN